MFDPTPASAAQPEPSFTGPWPTYTPDVLRVAATRLEQRPWLKPVEALRLWADVMEMEQRMPSDHAPLSAACPCCWTNS